MKRARYRGGGDLLPGERRPGTLAWMMAACCFLAVIAVAAALGLARAADKLDRAGAGRFTIELVDPDPARLEAAAARLTTIVGAEPSVRTVVRVPPSAITALLEPTLGRAGLDTLPIPALIEVALRRDAPAGSLGAIVRRTPGAQLIRATDGLAPLASLVATLRRLALGIVAIAAVVTLLVAVLAARTALEAHGPTLAILHALGASDRDLATLVQHRTARDALIGGAIGLAGGAAAAWIVAARFTAIGQAPSGGALIGAGGWIALILVPLVLAAGATLATRLTVLAMLERAP